MTTQLLLWIGAGVGILLWAGSAAASWVKKQIPAQQVTRVTTATVSGQPTLPPGDDRLLLLAYLVAVRDRLITADGCAEAIDTVLIPALMAQKVVKG